MLATLTAALLLGAPPAPEPAAANKDAPPAKLQLFADDSWYKNQKGEEKDFVGVLSRAPTAPGGAAALGRFNPYRLTMTDDKGKQSEREIYAGAHPELLAPYVGRKIKLIGKAVDTEVEGKLHAEIWPARVELMEATPETPVAPPDELDVLSGNKVYNADATPEKDYVGILRKKKGEDAVGYTLLIDAEDFIDRQDIHLFNQQYSLFDPYAGMRVKITGKKVSGTKQGVPFSYILPRRLVVLGDKSAGEKTARELKVQGVANEWPFGGLAPAQFAVRSPRELVLARGLPANQADDDKVQTREAELTARQFKLESIDWNRQMLIVATAGAEPTGGYTVEITRLVVDGDVLHVHWRVNAPKPGDVVTQQVTHPAQAVLTEHFTGDVVFEGPKATSPGK